MFEVIWYITNLTESTFFPVDVQLVVHFFYKDNWQLIIHTTTYTQYLYIIFSGKGRGKQVISVARTSDLVVIMLDATKKEIQK